MRRDEAKDEMRGGLLVPAGLLVNELTLREKKDHVEGLRMRMTHELARRCGFSEAEILDVLGPEPGREGQPS